MTTIERRRRGWTWLLLPLLLAAGGCGPGVGGTGTGEGFALDFFGAKRASVCTASFAGELRCPSRIVIGPTPAPAGEGSEPVLWVDDPANGRFTARIDASDVEFDAKCEGIRFSGTYGKTDEDPGRFFGNYTAPGLDAAVPGTLSVEGIEEAGLSYVLRNADGQTVIGPLLLQRTNAEPQFALCPTGLSSGAADVTYR